MDNQLVLTQAKAAIEAEDFLGARNLLWKLVQETPDIEEAWLLLAHISQDKARTISFLEQALRINPENQGVQKDLERLNRGEVEEVSLFAALNKPKNQIEKLPKDFYQELKPVAGYPALNTPEILLPEISPKEVEELPKIPPPVPVIPNKNDNNIPPIIPISPQAHAPQALGSPGYQPSPAQNPKGGGIKLAWLYSFLIGAGSILFIYFIYPIFNVILPGLNSTILPTIFLIIDFLLILTIIIILFTLFRKATWIGTFSMGMLAGTIGFAIFVFLNMG
jgi:hypothetical protein